MKRNGKILAALLICALCLSCVSALASGSVTTTGQLNLRTGPGLDYASVGTVPKGVTLSYTNTAVDDRGVTWFRVHYGSKKGWISSTYTNYGGGGGYTSASGTVTTTGQLNLRTGAGLYYSSIGTVPKGVTLSYSGTDVDDRGVTWFRVNYNGKHGWISSTYTNYGSGYASVSGKVTTTGKLNLRTGPALYYMSLGTVPSGVTLVYTDTDVDDRGVVWYRVTYGGDTGWISSMYTNLGGGSYYSGNRVVITSSVNVRTGPGLGYKSIGTLERYDSAPYKGVKSVDDRGIAWYKINYQGKTGWVSSVYSYID